MVPWPDPCKVYLGDTLDPRFLLSYKQLSNVVQSMEQIDCRDIAVAWASCQIRKIAGAHAPGMLGTFSPPPRVSDPDLLHGTCVTHVLWCMTGLITSDFLWSRWGKRSQHSRRIRNPQVYVSGKRPMASYDSTKHYRLFMVDTKES